MNNFTSNYRILIFVAIPSLRLLYVINEINNPMIKLLTMRSWVPNPGASTFLNVDYVCNGVHPALRGQFGMYLIEEKRIWLRKSTLLDLMERNVNHIIPSYCHLPVSCRSLVDRCGSLGSCKPQIYFFNDNI